MSYRDLRNFTEMMRALGYPRLISMENFRQPNFTLVAEILQWLVLRYDPNTDIPMDVELENDRVLFIKSVAQFMMTKAHIKLNTKKLYSADGMSVKELLKVTSILYNAAMKMGKDEHDTDSVGYNPRKFEFNSKIGDLKMARQLASEITVKGSSLHELLGREVQLREIRASSVARPMDLNEIEKNIEQMTNDTVQGIDKARNQLENLASDEANLQAKIEKRKSELERNQKRLKSLESVRPAFMDEYENLEKDLEALYKLYIEKYRNLTYLEQINEEANKTEQDRLEDSENPLKIAVRVREEHENLIRESLNFNGSESEEEEGADMLKPPGGKETKSKKGGDTAAAAASMSNKPSIVGSMAGGGLDSEEDDSEGLSSGSEVGEDDLLDDDDDDDDDDEIDDGSANDSDDNF